MMSIIAALKNNNVEQAVSSGQSLLALIERVKAEVTSSRPESGLAPS
jgi:hypothetical protein